MNVVKDDDGEAQLVYVYNFDPDLYKRDVTVNLDGREIGVFEDQWAWDNDIYVEFLDDGILPDMVNDGYDLVYTVTYGDNEPTQAQDFPVGITDSDYVIDIAFSIPDVVIDIYSSHVDIFTDGNLTLNTVGAYDEPFDADAENGSIYMDRNGVISYTFVLDYIDGTPVTEPITNVSWDETIKVGNRNPVTQHRSVSGAGIDGDRIYGVVEEIRPNASEDVTVYISNLVVNYVEPEEPIINPDTEVVGLSVSDKVYFDLYRADGQKASLTNDEIGAYLESQGYEDVTVSGGTWSFTKGYEKFSGMTVNQNQVYKIGFASEYGVDAVECVFGEDAENAYAWSGSTITVTLGDNKANADWTGATIANINLSAGAPFNVTSATPAADGLSIEVVLTATSALDEDVTVSLTWQDAAA